MQSSWQIQNMSTDLSNKYPDLLLNTGKLLVLYSLRYCFLLLNVKSLPLKSKIFRKISNERPDSFISIKSIPFCKYCSKNMEGCCKRRPEQRPQPEHTRYLHQLIYRISTLQIFYESVDFINQNF